MYCIRQLFLQPGLLTWLHMHGLSFTLELWAKFLVFMSTIYAWPYLKRPRQSTTVHIFVPPVSGLLLLLKAQIRIKLPCVLQLQSSLLRVTNDALWQSGLHWPSHASCNHKIDLREIFECAHLKSTASGPSKKGSKHTHTRVQCRHASVGLAQACLKKYLNCFVV